jgi:aspartyl/glutamyl-tRNA(Asn/Gln) amidotransferase C subunit
MSITKDDVIKIAKLAGLALSETAVESYVKELNHMLEWVQQLQSVDTENIEPMHNILDILQELVPDLSKRVELVDPNNKEDIECSNPFDIRRHALMLLIQKNKAFGAPMREDKIMVSDIHEEVLQNAPSSKYGYFVTPKSVT